MKRRRSRRSRKKKKEKKLREKKYTECTKFHPPTLVEPRNGR